MEERRNDLDFILQQILLNNENRKKIFEACNVLRNQKDQLKTTAITHSMEIGILLTGNLAKCVEAIVEDKITQATFELISNLTDFAFKDSSNITAIALNKNGEEAAAIFTIILENNIQLQKQITTKFTELNEENHSPAELMAIKQMLILADARTKILTACEVVRTQKEKMINEAQTRYKEIIESLLQISTECMLVKV